MRIDQALVKARAHVKEHYTGSKIAALSTSHSMNAEGARRGRAAADALHLSKGLTGSQKKGTLNS